MARKTKAQQHAESVEEIKAVYRIIKRLQGRGKMYPEVVEIAIRAYRMGYRA
jgi:hypothetical protein